MYRTRQVDVFAPWQPRALTSTKNPGTYKVQRAPLRIPTPPPDTAGAPLPEPTNPAGGYASGLATVIRSLPFNGTKIFEYFRGESACCIPGSL